MKNENKTILNIFEVCERYNLPTKWVKQQTKTGGMPCLKIGKRLFFCPAAVEMYLSYLASKGGKR